MAKDQTRTVRPQVSASVKAAAETAADRAAHAGADRRITGAQVVLELDSAACAGARGVYDISRRTRCCAMPATSRWASIRRTLAANSPTPRHRHRRLRQRLRCADSR